VIVLPSGPRAWVVEVGSAAEAAAVYARAREAGLELTDLVPGARSVLFDGLGRDTLDGFLSTLRGSSLTDVTATGGLVEVPTTYDGPDLADVAAMWDMSVEEAVERHTGTEFVVAFCGFSPGFAYCTGLPDELSVPRLDTPRTKVPAGSVAVAGEFTGVYPRSSPGGWRLLGRTRLGLWDTGARPPALLTPGTRVRFRAVAGDE
jgi:KipI family sensor histidine kinase inhibitor